MSAETFYETCCIVAAMQKLGMSRFHIMMMMDKAGFAVDDIEDVTGYLEAP